MSNFNKRRSRGLEKVLYILAAAIILIVLATLLILGFRDNPSNETEVTTAGKILPVEDDSKNNDKAKADQTFQEAAGKSINSAKEGASGAAEEEDKDTTNESQSGSATSWFLISVFTLSTVANGCIAVFIFRQTRESDKLQRERIKLLSDRKCVEPEVLLKEMSDLSENTGALDKQLSELKQNNDRTVQSLAQQTSAAISGFEKDNQQTGEKIQEIMNSLSVFKESLDDKDEEIKRYKEGHDSKLISKYILSYIKVRDQIIKMTNSDQLEFKNLEQLADRLSMEIDHAGVKEIEVSVGDKFLDDKYGGKLAAPKLVPTDVPENDGIIKSVDLVGYEFTGNDRNIILRPAKVSVYKLEQAK